MMFGSSHHRGTGLALLSLGLVLTLLFPQISPHSVKGSPSIIRVPQDFLTIQEAVDAARAGDTVTVDVGEYVENVVVGKSISLRGVSPDTTTIDANGSGPGIRVNATTFVIVHGFTVKNTGFFDSGIVIDSSSQITIDGNVIEASAQSNGTYVYNSNSSIVRGNIVSGNAYGITVQGGFGNLIQENNATGNLVDAVGIFSSAGNRIVDNILRKSVRGIELSDGSAGNIIARNIVANNTVMGISLDNVKRNLFVENRVEFNSGPNFQAGIWLHNASGNRFYHNNIRNNTVCCPSATYQVFHSTPGDVVSNFWENVTRTVLGSDPQVTLVDANGNGEWDPDETIVYDSNGDGVYSAGDFVVASAKGVVVADGTLLRADSRIRFSDSDSDGRWGLREPLVYDNNDNGNFEQGEPGLASVGGNYWSDYSGLDDGSRGFAGNMIGDSSVPHPCPNGGKPCSLTGPAGVDSYPLIEPWQVSGVNVTVLATPSGGYAQLQVSFTSLVTGGVPPYAFGWDFGDGTTAGNSETVFHTYLAIGNYIATLTVTDASGSIGTGMVPVTILSAESAPTLGALYLKVLDEALAPIKGANVSSLTQPAGQTKISEVTNGQGIVAWANLVPGTYLIRASAQGYESGTKNVTLVASQTENENIILKTPAKPSTSQFLWVGIGAGLAAGTVLAIFLLGRRLERRRTDVSARKPSVILLGMH